MTKSRSPLHIGVNFELLTAVAASPWYIPGASVLTFKGKPLPVSGLLLGEQVVRSASDLGAWALGTAGSDYIVAGTGPSIAFGGKGSDTIDSSASNQVLAGGAGADVFRVRGNSRTGSAATILDLAQNDTVEIEFASGSGREMLSSARFAAAVSLYENVFADAGKLIFNVSTNKRTFVGSAHDDIIDAENENGVRVDGGAGNDSITSAEGADTLIGGDGNDTLQGLGGGDRLDGGAGADTIFFYKGDTLVGDDAQDTIIVASNGVRLDEPWRKATVVYNLASNGGTPETLRGGKHDDIFNANGKYDVVDLRDGGADQIYVNAKDVTILGLSADDTIFVTTSDAATRAKALGAWAATGATITFELFGSGDEAVQYHGWKFNDMMDGGDGNDTLLGYEGNDILVGGGGNDVLWGGTGHDGLSGGFGDDVILGDEGNDTCSGDEGNDFLIGGRGSDYLDGGAGADTLWGDGPDVLDPTARDTLVGNAGSDELHAGAGATVLIGGTGKDTLIGGDGDDRLAGGDGADRLTGGGGADRFVFNPGEGGRDEITDFQLGVDVVDLHGFTLIDNFDAATLIRGTTFDCVTGILSVDANGDGFTDLTVLISSLKGQHVNVSDLYVFRDRA